MRVSKHAKAAPPVLSLFAEFIQLVATQAQELATKSNNKVLQPRHVFGALEVRAWTLELHWNHFPRALLQMLEFMDLVDFANEAQDETRAVAKVRGVVRSFGSNPLLADEEGTQEDKDARQERKKHGRTQTEAA